MLKKPVKKKIRQKKHLRIRKNIKGTADRPRLAVYRSLKNIYAQVIDDKNGATIVAASTLDPEMKQEAYGGNTEAAKKVGQLVASRAKEKGIDTVVFDRGGNIYHGRIKALAEGAREGGLEF